jgi:hypothetical protein
MTLGKATMMLLALAPAIPGCVTAERAGLIPLGEWTGRGTFVFEEWPSQEPVASQPSYPTSVSRDYPTHLSIERVESEGHEFIVLDILSERGPMADLGDATHLEAALAEAKVVSDSVVLYRVVDWNFNPGPDKKLSLKPPSQEPPYNASCIRLGDSTVLRIQYTGMFDDTLRFRGRLVEKEGAYYDEQQGIIHWSEALHPGHK